MFDYSGRKILLGVVAGTLLSTTMTSAMATNKDSHYLLMKNQEAKPVMTKRANECVLIPQTPNTPAKLFEQCGDSLDRDGDGIRDNEDKCPDNTPEEISKGVYQSGDQKGCPLDSDNDGVPDYRDDCPNNTPEEISKGVDERGCPLDTDQDGVADYKDECPNTPFGMAVDEKGCQIIEKEEKFVLTGDVNFAYNKANLTPQARMTLDNFVRKISNPTFVKLEIVGHTDSRGSDDYNQGLSERRAMSVAEYLMDNGAIAGENITQWGEGERNPIASNNTKVGRAKNRRVEIKIITYKRK